MRSPVPSAGQDAEEVAQRTWLQVLEGDPRFVRSPRTWLGSAVRGVAYNLRRTRDRRRSHERLAARRDRVASSLDVVQRQERRRELVRAVDALPEPQRVVVLLRYFEDMPPRQIAAHLGLSVTTVTSRLRSALATLRGRLDAGHADRAAWLLPLLPRGREASARRALLCACAFRAKLTAIVALVALTALGLWASGLWLPTPSAPPGGPAAHPQPVPMAADTGSDRLDAGAVVRSAVPGARSEAGSDTGAVALRVRIDEDRAPVADLLVFAGRSGADSRFGQRRARTDKGGTARFEGLPPGRWKIGNARNTSVESVVEVTAGSVTDVILELPAGTRLVGVVVDPYDVPVPDARVYLKHAFDIDAEHAATTEWDGRFTLRACPRTVYIGARAAGYAPSRMQLVQQGSGTKELRIVLPGPGGIVEGIVRGPGGEPVADALVLVGEGLPNRNPVRGPGAPTMPAQARTGADGQFRAVGLTAGDHLLRVRAARAAPWAGSCQVYPHATTTVQVTLADGLTCCGVVVDATDQPLAGTWVEAGHRDEFAYYRTRSAADGSFLLEGLPPGGIEVRASNDDGEASLVVRGASGETVACKLQIDLGTRLEGQLVSVDGVDYVSVRVSASAVPAEGRPAWHAIDRVGTDGRFVVSKCPPGRLLTHAG